MGEEGRKTKKKKKRLNCDGRASVSLCLTTGFSDTLDGRERGNKVVVRVGWIEGMGGGQTGVTDHVSGAVNHS